MYFLYQASTCWGFQKLPKQQHQGGTRHPNTGVYGVGDISYSSHHSATASQHGKGLCNIPLVVFTFTYFMPFINFMIIRVFLFLVVTLSCYNLNLFMCVGRMSTKASLSIQPLVSGFVTWEYIRSVIGLAWICWCIVKARVVCMFSAYPCTDTVYILNATGKAGRQTPPDAALAAGSCDTLQAEAANTVGFPVCYSSMTVLAGEKSPTHYQI